jgi:alpha-L-fucosidase
MWDTAQTPYNIMNTPYRRDILEMLAEACHRRDFPLCLYYSIVDMNQPNYPNQGRSYERSGPEPGDEPDLGKYLAFLRAQVRELCTRYGEISGFWWDANVIRHCDPSINQMIRALQPNAVINDRGFDCATGFGGGDFGTPERDYNEGQVDEATAFARPTEACQAVGAQSWGYREDEDYFTDRYIMESIAKVLAKGGNYLLNVGPKADGAFPDEAAGILRRIGKWYRQVEEALVAEPASHLVENRDVVLTQRGNKLYVILHRPPTTDAVLLKPLNVMPRSAKLLNTGEDVACSTDLIPALHDEGKGYLRLHNLPVNEHTGEVLAVRLEFDGEPISPPEREPRGRGTSEGGCPTGAAETDAGVDH